MVVAMRWLEQEADLPPQRAPEPCPLPVRDACGRMLRSLAGWLLLLPGVAILISTALIASGVELDRVHAERDRVLAVEVYERERLDRLDSYVAAMERPGKDLMRVLEATNLNRFGPGERALPFDRVSTNARARVVLATLDPPRPAILAGAQPERVPVSLLERWSTNNRSRLWLIGAGAALVLLGLVPWGARPEQL